MALCIAAISISRAPLSVDREKKGEIFLNYWDYRWPQYLKKSEIVSGFQIFDYFNKILFQNL